MYGFTGRVLTAMVAAASVLAAAQGPAQAQESDDGSVVAAAATNPAPDGPVRMTAPAPGGMVPVAPARMLDTRTGLGARKGVVGQGETITV